MLPAGALDKEKPDSDRFTEATGNEGATFDRSYHRAALVIWPRRGYAAVLLQAGAAAAMPYLAERLDAKNPAAGEIAGMMVDLWEKAAQRP